MAVSNGFQPSMVRIPHIYLAGSDSWEGPQVGLYRVQRFQTSNLPFVSPPGSCYALAPRNKPSSAMKVDVHLPNGDGCYIEVSPALPVSELKAAAQHHFQRRLKLSAKGRQLDLTATLSETGLQCGDVVTAVVQ